MTPYARRRKKCRKVLGEYIGRGGPPLHAPLPMEARCDLGFNHKSECETYDLMEEHGLWERKRSSESQPKTA